MIWPVIQSNLCARQHTVLVMKPLQQPEEKVSPAGAALRGSSGVAEKHSAGPSGEMRPSCAHPAYPFTTLIKTNS